MYYLTPQIADEQSGYIVGMGITVAILIARIGIKHENDKVWLFLFAVHN